MLFISFFLWSCLVFFLYYFWVLFCHVRLRCQSFPVWGISVLQLLDYDLHIFFLTSFPPLFFITFFLSISPSFSKKIRYSALTTTLVMRWCKTLSCYDLVTVCSIQFGTENTSRPWLSLWRNRIFLMQRISIFTAHLLSGSFVCSVTMLKFTVYTFFFSDLLFFFFVCVAAHI